MTSTASETPDDAVVEIHLANPALAHRLQARYGSRVIDVRRLVETLRWWQLAWAWPLWRMPLLHRLLSRFFWNPWATIVLTIRAGDLEKPEGESVRDDG